ncbi:hypothetical protein [Nocardioides terrigena]|uniref:hypothetical protein n=1 Tax=Nocardioides terrigena TaxID=424797 RepID=UPI000D317ED2|nr:hypothetical protein [Nocardioides terrigena]
MPEPSDAVVIAALAAVVQDHGWRIVSSPPRLRASLSDLLGARADDHQPAIDALVVSAEEGVPQDVRAAGRPGLASVRPDLEERLREWGMSDGRAAWAVQSWIELLPVTTAPHPDRALPSDQALHPTPAPTEGHVDGPSSPAPSPAAPVLAPIGRATKDPVRAPGHAPDVTLAPPVAREGTTPDPEPDEDTTASQGSGGPGAPTILPPPGGGAPPMRPAAHETPGRRRLVLVSVAALLLVGGGVAAAVAMKGQDPAKDSSDSSTSAQESSGTPSASASATASAAPAAEGTEIGAAPTGVTVAPAAGRFVMAGRSGGVRLAGLDEVDEIGRGGDVRSPPDGGRLVAFRLDDAACGVPPCTPWSDLGLKVAVGSDLRRLPQGDGPFVVAVPAGVEDVDLLMRGDGFTQTLSLLDGTPGKGNIKVLARQGRAVRVGSEFTVMEETSIPLAYNEGNVSSLPREVVVERAELKFFVGGLRPSGVDRAFLAVRTSYTIPYSVPGGPPPGTPRAFELAEVRFVAQGGTSYPARDLDQGPGRSIGFEVPADLRRGTLRIGGSYGLTAGDGVTPFTVTVGERSVPIRFS